jgi:di/tricarboxylate transporter
VAIGSAFLDNATVVPMLIPSLRDLCRRKRLPASKLFLPLSYAAILGGATTLIGTPANLIIAGLVTDRLSKTQLKGSLIQELHLFDPAWIGLPVAIFGIGIIFLLGQRLLPEKNKAIDLPHRHRFYRAEFRLRQSAPLVGQTFQAADLTGFGGAELISFTQTENIEQQSDGNQPLQGGDILAYKITVEDLPHLWKNPDLIPLNTIRKMETRRHTHQFVEVAAAPTASVIGRKVSELSLLNHPYKMAVVAMSRQGRPLELPLQDARIEIGDNVILEVDAAFFHHNRKETEFALIRRVRGFQLQRTDRALTATAITITMVIVAALGWTNLLAAAMLAAGLMLVTGCMDLRTAGQNVNFANLTVLACAVGLEAVVVDSGLSQNLAGLVIGLGVRNPHLALATIFMTTVVAANLISGASAAALVFPVAVSLAGELNLCFTPVAVTMMMGACPFTTPTATPTNLAVYGPGGYRFLDYIRLGVPLTILSGTLTVFLVPIVFNIGSV